MEKLVFTNGCFDILHPGHIKLLKYAKSRGTKLIVGINSDESVSNLKGSERPFLSQKDRKKILENLKWVDEVKIFNELTPENLIREIKPDVLVKGGDWKENEIIGAEFVKKSGGEVCTVPLEKGVSSSNIIEKIKNKGNLNRSEPRIISQENAENEIIERTFLEHQGIFSKLRNEQGKNIYEAGLLIKKALINGSKLLICGNGGSAADAQHLATEFVCRYELEREGLPAIALTTDTSLLTALSNDFEYSKVFSRQVQALARQGDVLIAISTSGESENVIKAVMAAREKKVRVVGLTGANGKKLASLCDICIKVPGTKTSRIQEMHLMIEHIWCEISDQYFSNLKN